MIFLTLCWVKRSYVISTLDHHSTMVLFFEGLSSLSFPFYLENWLLLEDWYKNLTQEQTNRKIFRIFHQIKSNAIRHWLVILFCFWWKIWIWIPSTCLIPKYRNGSYMTYQTYPKKEGFIQSQHLMIVMLSYRVNLMKIIWYLSCFGYKNKAMVQNYTWNVNATINTYIQKHFDCCGWIRW